MPQVDYPVHYGRLRATSLTLRAQVRAVLDMLALSGTGTLDRAAAVEFARTALDTALKSFDKRAEGIEDERRDEHASSRGHESTRDDELARQAEAITTDRIAAGVS